MLSDVYKNWSNATEKVFPSESYIFMNFFLKKFILRNASNHIINTIIQYNYHLLPAISINIYSQKWEAYLSNDSFNEEIYLKVAFPYEKLETRALPIKLIQTYNFLTTNNKCTECSSKDRTVLSFSTGIPGGQKNPFYINIKKISIFFLILTQKKN